MQEKSSQRHFTNPKSFAIIHKLCAGGSMDRASDSGSEGWGFESLPVYQKRRYPNGCLRFWYLGRKGFEKLNATVRWTVAADGLTEANLDFLSQLREKMQTSPFRCTPPTVATIPQSKIKDFCQLPLHKGACRICAEFWCFLLNFLFLPWDLCIS